MAYTQADLESVQNAIVELATGKRMVRLTVGDRTFEFGQAQMERMAELREQIKAELAAATDRPRFWLTRTSKGL